MIKGFGAFRWAVPVLACAALAIPLGPVKRAAASPAPGAVAPVGAITLAARNAAGEPYDYVALGDSYSSGEGNPPFDRGTADSQTGDTCHRSAQAWPRLMAAGDRHLHLLGLLACSGAQTPDIYRSRFKTEPVQLDHLKSLHPRRDTVVTITIGGNDVGFAPTFTDCYEHDCYTDGRLARAVSAIKHQLPGELASAFKAVARAVPAGSRVVVVGYPNIITPSHASRGRHCRLWLTTHEEDGLVAAASLMDKTERAAASAAGLGYVSTLHVLAGHELCTGRSWVKSVNVLTAVNPQTRQQFGHPLLAGQQAIAAAVESYLSTAYLHYTGGTLHIAGAAGSPLSGSASVSGGALPLTVFAGIDGNPPSWLTLSLSGRKVTLSGTPPRAGTWAFDIEVEDARQYVVTIPVTVTASGTWSAAEAPLPANAVSARGTSLQAVACPSASACVAGGDYQDSAGAQQALLLTESGGVWKPTEVALPAGAAASPGAIINSVTCPAAGTCIGAGWYTDSAGQQQALLVTGWGTSWKTLKVPLPPRGVGGSLVSVACSTASSCTAVGQYELPTSSQALISQALMVTGAGASWTAVQAPLPADSQASLPSTLQSVACSPDTCAATGYYNWQAQYNSQGLLLRKSGSAWTPTTAPMPAGYQPSPSNLSIPAVACSSASCVAVGWYQDKAGNFQGVLLTDTGQGWIDMHAPLPANAGPDGVNVQGQSVTCPSASTCVADSSYISSTGESESVILTGLGSSWSAAQTPLPADADAHYDGTLGPLACASDSACAALGGYINTAYFARNMAVTGWGTGWAATGTPLPPNADANAADNPYTAISAVTCPSADRCVAVGSYTDSSGAGQGLLLTGNG